MKKFNKPIYLLMLLMFSTICTVTLNAGDVIKVNSSNKNLLPKGKEVDGMIGDWIMKNDKVIAVIAAAYPDREANQMVSSIQGAVIDFTTLASNNDQLVVYYPQGARVDIPAADTIIVLSAKGKIIQLKAIRYATRRDPYTAETTYTLQDGKNYLEVSTVYTNTTSEIIKLKTADRLRCDNDLTDVTPEGSGQLAYIYNKWYDAAYGIAVVSGSLYTKAQEEKPKLTDVGLEVFYPGNSSVPEELIQLPAGEKISIERVLLTGNDISDVQKVYSSVSNHPFISWGVNISDTKSKKISDAFIFVKNQNDKLVSASKSDRNGNAILYLEKGNYKFNITKLGHDTVFRDVTVAENGGSSQFSLQPQTTISVTLSGPDGNEMPVKIEFRGKTGTRDPFLGPSKRSKGTGNLYFSNSSRFVIPVPPGTYEMAFSHGPEYDVIMKTVTIKRGEMSQVNVVMKRSFSTRNWIVADMHNHTTGSGDSGAETESRVINLAAAGIEFAPATEHNRISTFTGVIKQLGLKKYIASCPGVELSGRPGPGDINHQIGFPVKIQDGKRGYGAPKTDKDPYVQMKRLYDYDNGEFKLMQQNHPNIGWLYFDKDRDGITDNGFGTAAITDVLEINGTVTDFPGIIAGQRSRSRLLPWLQMLNQGYRILATANSDAHAMGHGSGSVFSYVYTKNDTPGEIDAVEIAHQVKSGHLVISNGPFLDVRVDGGLPGSDIRCISGKVNVKVKVFASNWCPVNTVQIVINGRADKAYIFSAEKNPELFHQGPMVFEQEIPVLLSSDAHLIVIAYGKGQTVGKVQGGPMRNALPIAMANPVFVDVDGNGFVANKDILDNPLPNGKPGRAFSPEVEE